MCGARLVACCLNRTLPGTSQMMTSKATRSEISQALAKAIAYRDCGKPREAEDWAARLVRMLEAEAILRPEYVA